MDTSTWLHAEHGATVRKFGRDMLDDRANKLTIKTWIRNLMEDAEAANWLATRPAAEATAAAGRSGAKNPFVKGSPAWNLTEQGRLVRENPAMAKQLASAAGVKLDI